MKDALKDYLISIPDSFIRSFIQYHADKLKDEVVDLVGKFDVKEITKKVQELKGKLVGILHKKIHTIDNDNYKDDSAFKDFNLENAKIMIEEILEKENVYTEINDHFNSDFKDFKLENNSNIINVLLMGKEKEDIETFNNIIFRIFTKNENCINIKFNEYFTSIDKLNIIEYKGNLSNNINCIWYIIDEKKNEITFNDIYKNLPIIYIGFKGKIAEETKNLENFEINSENNLNVINNFLIEIHNINDKIEKDKKQFNEFFMRLIEKTVLNIIFTNYRINIENKAKDILSSYVMPRINFSFGNKISNFYILNKQIMPIIFKQFLNLKKLPNYIQTNYKKFLHDYHTYLEEQENSYFSEFISKNSKELKKKSKNKDDKLDNKLLYNMFSFMSENEKNKDDKKENKKKMIKVNSVCEDDLDAKVKIAFEDYFLNRSSIFINESIINTIKEMKINYYNKKISHYYIKKYKKEEIII